MYVVCPLLETIFPGGLETYGVKAKLTMSKRKLIFFLDGFPYLKNVSEILLAVFFSSPSLFSLWYTH